jgi:hypothetical protein
MIAIARITGINSSVLVRVPFRLRDHDGRSAEEGEGKRGGGKATLILGRVRSHLPGKGVFERGEFDPELGGEGEAEIARGEIETSLHAFHVVQGRVAFTWGANLPPVILEEGVRRTSEEDRRVKQRQE